MNWSSRLIDEFLKKTLYYDYDYVQQMNDPTQHNLRYQAKTTHACGKAA